MGSHTKIVINYVKLLLGVGLFTSSLALGIAPVSATPIGTDEKHCVAWGEYFVEINLINYLDLPTDWEAVEYFVSDTNIVFTFSSSPGAYPGNLFIEPYFFTDSACTTSVDLPVSGCLTPVNPGTTDNYPTDPYPYGFTLYLTEVSGGEPGVQIAWSSASNDASFYGDYNYQVYEDTPLLQALEGSLVLTLLTPDLITDLGDNTVDSTVAATLCDTTVSGGGAGGGSRPSIDWEYYLARAGESEAAALPDTL